MKKALLALGLTVTTLSIAGTTASATAYQSPAVTMNYVNESRCERLAARIADLNSTFDQTDSASLWREQRLIDRHNEAGCVSSDTIVDTLVKNGNFKTLVAAVTAAGLGDALSAPGDKTVFAPTDQAFAALPAGTVEGLLQNLPALTTVLTNHVVAGNIDAATAADAGQATTLGGGTLQLSAKHWTLYVNGATVVLNDIQTSNGVIHVIDRVLVP